MCVIYVCISCAYTYVYICMCVYMYIYTYISHKYTHTQKYPIVTFLFSSSGKFLNVGRKNSNSIHSPSP